LAAEVGDVLFLSVLGDLEVVAAQAEDGLAALVEDGDGDAHRARGGAETQPSGTLRLAGRGGRRARRRRRRDRWRRDRRAGPRGRRAPNRHHERLARARLAQRRLARHVERLGETAVVQLEEDRVLADARTKEEDD